MQTHLSCKRDGADVVAFSPASDETSGCIVEQFDCGAYAAAAATGLAHSV